MTREEAIDVLENGKWWDFLSEISSEDVYKIELDKALDMALAALREQEEAPELPKFSLIDTNTGAYPDVGSIALNEEWAKGLVYCDIDCFAIQEDGNLILIDDCGNIAYPPAGRFRVVFADDAKKPNTPLTLDELRQMAQRCEGVYVAHVDGSPVFRGKRYCAAVLDFSPAFGSNTLHVHVIYGDRLTLWEDDYGKTWLAYRSKPKEDTNV